MGDKGASREVGDAAVVDCERDDGWETLMGARLFRPSPVCANSILFLIPFAFMSSVIPQTASAAVLKQSEPVSDEAVAVQGPDFDQHLTLETLLDSYERIGFQANSLGKAIKIVDKMVGAPL